jgi:ABC-type multidrug transport system fused ATPase/permease subunit
MSSSTRPLADSKPSHPRLRLVLPLLLDLIRPKLVLVAVGFGIMAINRVSGLVLPYTTQFLIDSIVLNHRFELLKWLVLAMSLGTVVHSLTTYLLGQMSKPAEHLISDLRRRVRAHVGRLPIAFYDANQTGTVVSRIMRDIEGVRSLISTEVFEFSGALITIGLGLVILFRINAPLTVLAFGLLLCFALGLKKGLTTIASIFRDVGSTFAEVAGRLTESVAGVRVVKVYNAEDREGEVFAKGSRRLLSDFLRARSASSLMSLFGGGMVGVLTALIIYVGAQKVIAGTLSIGGFFTYIWIMSLLDWPISQVVSVGMHLSESLSALERTYELLRERPEYPEPKRIVQLHRVSGRIQFENVCFSYDGIHTVLHDISFQCEPGTVTALVGSSGAGKSTIIGLISAFYAPTGGRILVDEVDLNAVQLDSYRRFLGAVQQESFLFDGTIRENVVFSRPAAEDEEVIRACKIARVDEFAEKLTNRYDTVVGERGVKLSCGQRQRISIARAILAAPPILMLDEATSSLDSESEAMVQQALSSLMDGRTTIVIAHRLSTIRNSDQILVMERGRLVERGTHTELYALQGRYYDLYARQHESRSMFVASVPRRQK